MSYLSVQNFWKYQNADVWKKSKGHPPWFKHWVNRDRELDALPLLTRLVFYELLAAATRHSNVLEADLKWLWAETRVDSESIRESLPALLKGGWLSETKTPRRSRKPSREVRDDRLDLREEEVEVKDKDFDVVLNAEAKTFAQTVVADPKGRAHHPYDPPSNRVEAVRRLIGRTIRDEVDLEAELSALRINGAQADELRTCLAASTQPTLSAPNPDCEEVV